MSIVQVARAKQARVGMLYDFARECGIAARRPSKLGSLFTRKKTLVKIEMRIADLAHVHPREILAFANTPLPIRGGASVKYNFSGPAQNTVALKISTYTLVGADFHMLTPEDKSALALEFMGVFRDLGAAAHLASAIVPEDALKAQRKIRYSTTLRVSTRAEMLLAEKMPLSDVPAALEYSLQEDVQSYLANRLTSVYELSRALANPTLLPKVAAEVVVPRLRELSANPEA